MAQDGKQSRTGNRLPGLQPSLLPSAAALLVVLLALGWLAVAARGFLLPIVIALLLLYLVTAAERLCRRARTFGVPIPKLLITPIAVVIITLPVAGMVWIIIENAAALQAQLGRSASPDRVDYAANFDALIARLPLEEDNPIENRLQRINLVEIMRYGAASAAAILGNIALVAIYLFFLLFERRVFHRKLWLIVPDENARRKTLEMIDRVEHHVGMYLGLKTLISLVTALPSYAVMKFAGLEFAAFWALLIFVLNFIPNVGSLIATAAPTFWAVLQNFDPAAVDWTPVWIVGVGVSVIQLVVANLIEPPLMGSRLNLSPFVVILALVFWTLLWGIPGAFLGVPMTALAVIVLAQFKSTRPVAVALSRNGMVGVDDIGEGDNERPRDTSDRPHEGGTHPDGTRETHRDPAQDPKSPSSSQP